MSDTKKPVSFAATLRSVRQGLELSQAQLAKKIGVSERAVLRWEQRFRPSPIRLRALVTYVHSRDPVAAGELAASRGATLAAFGITTGVSLTSRAAVESALFVGAAAIDASPRALVAAFTASLERLRDYGISVEAALAALGDRAKA